MQATPAEMRGVERRPMRAGVTIIEVTCAVVIVGLVMGIGIPTVRNMRAAGRANACQANLRSCARTVFTYAEDFRGTFPYLAQYHERERAFPNGGMWLPYYAQTAHWPLAMKGYEGIAERRMHPSQLCPGNPATDEIKEDGYDDFVNQYPPSTIVPSDYSMSFATFTDPSLWHEGADPYDIRGFRAVRTDEVKFADAKVVLSEPIAYHLGVFDESGEDSPISIFTRGERSTPFTMAFADGSVRATPFRELAALPESHGLHTPTLATPEGIKGRDLR